MVKLILAFLLLASTAAADHWRTPARHQTPVLPVMPIGPIGADYERYSTNNYTWTFDWRRSNYYQPRPNYYQPRPSYRPSYQYRGR